MDTFKSLFNKNETNNVHEPLLQQSSSSKYYNSNNKKKSIPSTSSSLTSSTSSSINSLYFGSISSSSNKNRIYSNKSISYDVINNQSSNEEIINNNNNVGKITWIMAAFLLINAALGAGLLNYPFAYERLGGVIYATIIQIFASILMMTTMLILIYCSQINNENSYHGVMRTMCGEIIMRISAASITITCFGICVTFIIIIGDQFDRIFATYIGDDFCNNINWWSNRFFTMTLTTILIIWPICYFRSLDFLRHINILGVMASFYIIFLNIYTFYFHNDYYYNDNNNSNNNNINQRYQLKNTAKQQSLLEFIAALPVIFFAYQTHEIIIPIYNSMSRKNLFEFSKSILLTMLSLLIFYCLAGTYGYLYGSTFDTISPDIMLMYNANDPIILAGIIALIIKMITTYPPVVFCGRDTILKIILTRFQNHHHNEQQQQQQQHRNRSDYEYLNNDNNNDNEQKSNIVDYYERRLNIIITTIWNIIVLIMAILIPNITIALGFLGSLASCNVFIFPGIALFSLIKRYRKFNNNNNNHGNNNNENYRKRNFQQQNKINEQIQQQQQDLKITNRSVQMIDDDDVDLLSLNDNDNDNNNNYKSSLLLSNNLQKNYYLQIFLQIYSVFIILMGIIMFIIILIQVYYDFQNQSENGAVFCDTSKLSSKQQSSSLSSKYKNSTIILL